MKRRTFIYAAVSPVLLFAVALRAQAETAATAVRRIGFVSLTSPPSETSPSEIYAPSLIDPPLRDLGWVEGQNLIIERRYADGKHELLQPFAEELVRLNVEIIVTNGTDAAIAAKSATTRIPIVLFSAGDPVRTALIQSLARPGGNITGVSIMSTELDAKQLQLLRELVPYARRVGVLVDPASPINTNRRDEYELTFRSLGFQPIFVDVSVPNKVEDAVETVARQGGQALFVANDSLFMATRVALMRAALKYALPTMAGNGRYLDAGGLATYAPNRAEAYRRNAAFVDKILRGANPADLPIEQTTKFELGINLKTAKALRLTIPQSLLLRADRVIQ
jgi:putative tryptophan/tyrosine transport system substrate-binding protein